MSTISSKNMINTKDDDMFDDMFDRMTKARVVDNMDDIDYMINREDDDIFERMKKARVVDTSYIYLIHPTAAIIKKISNVVQTRPITEIYKIFNHNKIKKPKDSRKLARIMSRSISAEFIKRFLIPNYDGRPQTLVEFIEIMSKLKM